MTTHPLSDPHLSAPSSPEGAGPALSAPAFSPLYQQIKSLILQGLQNGEWKPGDLIPSELELAARFRVSQGTVRKAIDELAADNLLVRRQGKGTFVATHAEQHIQYRFLRLHPDTGTLDSEGPASRQILACRRLRAPADITAPLGLRAGDALIQVSRVLSFHGVPTILEDLWLPGGPFKALTLDTLAQHQGPMYALFESQFGVRMVRAEEKIKAVSANAQAAQLLDVPEGTPLLSVERVAFTYNDAPMELRRGLYRTDRHHYRNELS
ncbi:GntR family transcriptional regulator [Tepidicella baoligensis]|uniref:GntR family transcriptional regulator n=1 Tax=Tepidicella baoligensis TaxID=2707016 RepID=UPI0015DA5450|nr:GntR family transcriptional regulator [Tepidicella baoligensis]